MGRARVEELEKEVNDQVCKWRHVTALILPYEHHSINRSRGQSNGGLVFVDTGQRLVVRCGRFRRYVCHRVTIGLTGGRNILLHIQDVAIKEVVSNSRKRGVTGYR